MGRSKKGKGEGEKVGRSAKTRDLSWEMNHSTASILMDSTVVIGYQKNNPFIRYQKTLADN